MAEEILQSILESNISADQIIEWLSSEITTKETPKLFNCSTQQFTSFLINYLRDQTLWLMKDVNEVFTPRRNKVQRQSPYDDNKSFNSYNCVHKAFQRKLVTNETNTSVVNNLKSEHKKCRANLFPLNESSDALLTTSTPVKNLSSRSTPRKNSELSPSMNRSNSSSGSLKKLTLGDFLSIEPNSHEKKRKNRRITPTKVSTVGFDQSSIFLTSPLSEKFSPIPEDRLLLKYECDSLQNDFSRQTMSELDVSGASASNCSDVLKSTSNSDPEQLRDFSSISAESEITGQNVEVLLNLSRIYGFCIKKKLCANLMLELCFIATLLVARGEGKMEVRQQQQDQQQPFDSMEKCSRFAVYSCAEIKDLLNLLNASTLSLLGNNKKIIAWEPELANSFLSLSKVKQSVVMRDRYIERGNVSFQYETDNLLNFVGRSEFASFRKQRDLFYQLLQFWEQHHMERGWNFFVKLSQKIKTLIYICEEQTNLLHLARLFTNQLVLSCGKTRRKEAGLDEDLLNLMPGADPGRLSRLQARLSQPKYLTRGVAPLPSFPGHEEFFRDFIISAASSSAFCVFLRFILLDELLRHNEFDVQLIEENDSHIDEMMEGKFLENLSCTRILAKFFGFCDFFPFRTTEVYAETLINLHCSVRQKVQISFDLTKILTEAYENSTLILTVPWAASYLAMIDSCSARLPSFASTWNFLLYLKANPLQKNMPVLNQLLLQLTLDWLLDVAPVPPAASPVVPNTGRSDSGLDFLEIVTDASLYECCPFLLEFNAILAEGPGENIKHIRPVAIQTDHGKSAASAIQKLELRLEDSFLKNQSPSTRKCIQLVVERVASCCIKILIAEVIPSLKRIANKAEITAANIISEEKKVEICKKRINEAFKALLPCELTEPVIQACCEIACRQAIEKVNHWLQNNFDSVLLNDKNSSLPAAYDDDVKAVHVEPVSISECLSLLQEVAELASVGKFENDELLNTALQHFDPGSIKKEDADCIFQLCFDIIFHLYISCPGFEDSAKLIVKCMNQLITKKDSGQLMRPLCPRNLWTVKNSQKSESNAWLRLANCFQFLIANNLMSLESAKSQLTLCLERPLPSDIKNELIVLEKELK